MMKEKLIEEINNELEYLNITIESIQKLIHLIQNNEPDFIQKAAINQFVAEFYNGIENILKRIIKYRKTTFPYGEDSHIKLFNLFIENNIDDNPIIFDKSIADEFKKIRKFRHFIIHGYSFKVEWIYIKDSVSNLKYIYQIVKNNLQEYIRSL